MIVQCSRCNTKFKIDDNRLGPAGVKVRCSNCKLVFKVMPPAAPPAGTPLPASDTIIDDRFSSKTNQFYRPSADALQSSQSSAAKGSSRSPPRDRPPPALPGSFDSEGEKTSMVDTGKLLLRLAAETPPDEHESETRVGAPPALPELPGDDSHAFATVGNFDRRAPGLVERDARPATASNNEIPGAADIDTVAAPTAAAILQHRFVGGLCAFLLLLGFTVFASGERLYSWMNVRLGRVPELRMDLQPEFNGVRLTMARSVLYPTHSSSGRALVVTGEATNGTHTDQSGVDAVFELRDGSGKVVAQASAPVGLMTDLGEIAALRNQGDWIAAVIGERRKASPPTLGPATASSFRVVLLDPPDKLTDYSQAISLAATPALPPEPAAPPVAPPAPAPAPPPPPPPAAVESKHKVKKPKGGKHRSTMRRVDDAG